MNPLNYTAALVGMLVTGLLIYTYRRGTRPSSSHYSKLDRILQITYDNHLKLNKMANELATLTTEVAETKTVVQSAVTLIQGLKTRLDEAIASGDPAALTALSASLNSDQEALAAAIAANTPAENEGEGEDDGEDEEPTEPTEPTV